MLPHLISGRQKLDLFKQVSQVVGEINFGLTRSRAHFIIRTSTNKNCMRNKNCKNIFWRFLHIFFFFREEKEKTQNDFECSQALLGSRKKLLRLLLAQLYFFTTLLWFLLLLCHVLLNLFFGSFVYVFVCFISTSNRTTLICTWSLNMFPVVRCFHICEKLDDSGKCLSTQLAVGHNTL